MLLIPIVITCWLLSVIFLQIIFKIQRNNTKRLCHWNILFFKELILLWHFDILTCWYFATIVVTYMQVKIYTNQKSLTLKIAHTRGTTVQFIWPHKFEHNVFSLFFFLFFCFSVFLFTCCFFFFVIFLFLFFIHCANGHMK